MDPVQQVESMVAIEAAGWDLLGIFLSSSLGPSVPSPTDLANAYYPDSQFVIVSLQEPENPAVRSFYLGNARADEAPFIVV
ncbi:MAG: hypothetical protein R3C44_21005 [Chloroflexota bacterium]